MLCRKGACLFFNHTVALGWVSVGNQMQLAITDQIPAAHALKFVSEQWPVFRVVIAEKGFVQPALFQLVDYRQGVVCSTDAF